jgi:hypothetical protein
MEIIFNSENKKTSPRISFILIDWSIRESFHSIDYLNNQDIPRDKYELIWIEYYHSRHSKIRNKIIDYKKNRKKEAIDKWVIMEMPESVHYHKHLMYNIGLFLSKGNIVSIMDSDAIVTPGFIRHILDTFRQDDRIILHIDEVRNNSKKFYPFNYPALEEIRGTGCINWKNGRTTGLWDESDMLHTRNYGACMAALRKNLIKINGADEHIDFLGRICGPYEMTFRLRNLGLREEWSQTEFLYHVWHPGQTEGAYADYIGPSDSQNISTTALESLASGRTMPLVENKAIVQARKGLSRGIGFNNLIDKRYFSLWDKRREEVRAGFKNMQGATMVEGGYKEFNMIDWNGKIYAVSWELGPINWTVITEDKIGQYIEQKKCFIANSIEEAKSIVDYNLSLQEKPKIQ